MDVLKQLEKSESPMVTARFKLLLEAMEEQEFSVTEVLASLLSWTIDVAKHYGIRSYMPEILRVVADYCEAKEKETCVSTPE